jgi:protein gp37
MSKSTIEWTHSTWNPLTGCNKVSQGCKNCYAERMARRLKAMGLAHYEHGFRLTMHEDVIDAPLLWKKPRLIFVNSMSDLFHEKVPLDFIQRIFATMRTASWHQFQILTKRSQCLLELNPEIDWPSNVWMGVSVENEDARFRIDHLRKTGAKIKFLSLEPLLRPLPNLNLRGMHWVIVGGESGPGARPMEKEWVTDIRDQCLKTEVPFFFKQWGGVFKARNGRILEGRTWDDLPKKAQRTMFAFGAQAG